jgi:hypothetical protein
MKVQFCFALERFILSRCLKQSHLNVAEFGGDTFSIDGNILYCKMHDTKVAVEKRFTVQQHISRDKHIRAVQISKKKKKKKEICANVTVTVFI